MEFIYCPNPDCKENANKPAHHCRLGEPEPFMYVCAKCKKAGNAYGLVADVLNYQGSAPYEWLTREGFMPEGSYAPQPEMNDPLTHLAAIRGWDVEAMKRIGAEPTGRRVQFPMRDAEGDVTGHAQRMGDNSLVAVKSGEPTKSKSLQSHGLVYPVNGLTPDTPVLLCEGEADVVAAISAGYADTVGTKGCNPGKASIEYLKALLAGRDVILAPDGDKHGDNWRDDVGRALRHVQCRVRYIPPIEGKDLDDRLRLADAPADALEQMIAQSVDLQAPEPGPTLLLRTTDAGNGEFFAALYGSRVRYDHRKKRWLVWRGHWWAEDCDGQLHRMAKEAARERYSRSATLDDPDDKEAVAKWAVTSESRHRLDAALDLAKSERPIADSGDGWDVAPYLLAVENGVIDLRTAELRAGKPEDLLIRHVPHQYDPDAKCPRWDRFLDEVFAGDTELIEHVHKAAGYSLTGSREEQVWWGLYGSGANGKTEFLNGLRAMVGPHFAHPAPFSTFTAQVRGGGSNHHSDLANLAGNRIITAVEVKEGTPLNEPRLKMLTGEQEYAARAAYGKEERVHPITFEIWLAFNHRPCVRDNSHSFWRRARLIPMTQTFDDADEPDLERKIKAEAPGILAWAVRGCLAWQADGFNMPKAIETATQDYKHAADTVAGFIEDWCVVRDDAFCATGKLYAAYMMWAEEQQLKPNMTPNTFGERMCSEFEKTRPRIDGKRVRGYAGIDLAENVDEALEGP
jgi:putative DNA primase/helicase